MKRPPFNHDCVDATDGQKIGGKNTRIVNKISIPIRDSQKGILEWYDFCAFFLESIFVFAYFFVLFVGFLQKIVVKGKLYALQSRY